MFSGLFVEPCALTDPRRLEHNEGHAGYHGLMKSVPNISVRGCPRPKLSPGFEKHSRCEGNNSDYVRGIATNGKFERGSY